MHLLLTDKLIVHFKQRRNHTFDIYLEKKLLISWILMVFPFPSIVASPSSTLISFIQLFLSESLIFSSHLLISLIGEIGLLIYDEAKTKGDWKIMFVKTTDVTQLPDLCQSWSSLPKWTEGWDTPTKSIPEVSGQLKNLFVSQFKFQFCFYTAVQLSLLFKSIQKRDKIKFYFYFFYRLSGAT